MQAVQSTNSINCLKMSQDRESLGPDKWQINVLYDVENRSTLVLTVTKNCYTAELFEKLRQHPKAPQADDFQLFSIGGSIRSSLEESSEERLSDYDITDRSTLALVARLPGGVWPTMEEVAAEPRHLKPADGITLTTITDEHPDVLWIVYDGPGVIMRCGHATAPMPLALYCLLELEDGKDEIRCPECNNKWKFTHLKPAACLTQNEITEFEQRAHINYFRNNQSEMNACPRCGTFSRPYNDDDKRVVCENCSSRSGKAFEFCWTCLGEWKTSGNETCGNPNCGSNKGLIEILKNCETKQLNGVEVPCKRACPNCSMVIHHDDGCKHMTCRHCSYEFCFICLSKFPCDTDVYEPCDVAPCQASDAKFIVSYSDSEKQPYSEECADDSDLQRDEDSIDAHSSSYSAPQGDEMAAVMEDPDSNAISSDDARANTNDDISRGQDDVTACINNNAALNVTICASENAVNAVSNTSIGDDPEFRPNVGSDGDAAQPQTSNDMAQPNKTLETEKKGLSSASPETSESSRSVNIHTRGDGSDCIIL